jgi:nucleotide-binding universal stress UspA family protein
MLRRVLIATDGSDNALKSASYVAGLYRGDPDIEVTLLHVYPAIPPIYREGQHDPQIRKQFMAWKTKKEEEAERYISEASSVFQKEGMEDAHIVGKHHPQAVGVARDIIWEADAEGYDAVVIGLKGLGRIEEFFLGSITNKLLDLSVDHPLWVVEGSVTSRRVLISMDETEQTIELARYAGKMLKGLEVTKILLYHCCAPFSEVLTEADMEGLDEIGKRYAEQKRQAMAQFFDEATNVLTNCGIDKSLIESRFHFDPSVTDKRVSKSILSVVKKEQIGTVVMGRKGSTRAREYRMGSVCQRTLGGSRNCAIWIV